MHFKDWAKIYNLKNLCITLEDSMVRLAKKKVKKQERQKSNKAKVIRREQNLAGLQS